MKICISKAIYIETDELSDKELLESHAYYYQMGLKDVATQLIEEKEKREQAGPKRKKEEKTSDE